MNRIAVVSMIKNEADIIESSIRHWATFADKIYICDHKSTDKTRFILDSLREEGLNLEISTYNRDETDQLGIMNDLLQHALEEGFEIVLPLDADEFPIIVNGNSKDLREYLQNLDSNHCYRTYCWDHRFADEDESRFALSRKLVRAESFNPGLPKIIVGREPVIQYRGWLVTGQHHIYFKDQSPDYSVLDDSKIFYVHLGYRSLSQSVSKRILWYLGTRLKMTRYNSWGENYTPQQMADTYFGEIPPKLDLTNFIPTDLSEYKNEAVLKFSEGGGVKPGHALFLLASSYVKTLVRERILRKREIVRIFLLFDGEVDLAIRSLESCFDQTYPHKKIFIVLLTTKNVGELILAMGDRAAEVEFVDRSEFRKILESPDGSYVQFVTAGDRLDHDKLLHMVELNHSEHNTKIAFSALKPFDRKNLPPELEVPDNIETAPRRGYWLVWGIRGNDVAKLITKNREIIASGLSRGFFRQEVLENAWWIQNWLDVSEFDKHSVESSSIFLILSLVINRAVYFLDEELVERGSRDWIDRDFFMHQDLCQQVLSQIER